MSFGRRLSARGVGLVLAGVGVCALAVVTPWVVGAGPFGTDAEQLAGGAAGGATPVTVQDVTLDDISVDDIIGRDDAGVDTALTRAIEASRSVPHGGALTLVSFEEAAGPRISEVEVTRDRGAIRLARDGWEVGRVDGEAFLRSSDELLRIGGLEPAPVQLDRLRVKYHARLGQGVALDTGPATVLHLVDRDSGIRREHLYLDDETGLIVRRETFRADGTPARLVAYTELHASASDVSMPSVDGDVRDHAVVAADVDQLSDGRRSVPSELPGGFELLAAAEVDASTPAVHLLYGDGLYSLSVFQQEGRMARTAVDGATELVTSDGGAVWRWPGAEPRRVVWTGGGRTFTVLTDAPTDELLDALAGLPVDPRPSILDRLQRGMTRAGRWLVPGDGSDP